MSLSTNIWAGSVWKGSVWEGGVWKQSGFTPTDIPKSEAKVFDDLYATTDGASWTNTWDLTGKVADDLYGITVTTGHVTGIALNSNNLVGAVPSRLGGLSAVTTINLSGNTLTGLDAFVVALEASVNSNPRAGVLNISGADMEELTYGTEGSPSESAYAVMGLLQAGWTVTVQGVVPAWVYSQYTITGGEFGLATIDDGAMVTHDEDLSSFAGTDCLVRMTDDLDRIAEAYAYTAGTGEDYE